ncbi:MAG TPA: hypothetical protein VM165_13470, partial [Planctomycetaceae bacterium]|nr:hypothetical protein [Planctomycetaceae bacterium]
MTASPMPGSYLSLGQSDRAEFQPLRKQLLSEAEARSWRTVATLSEFLEQQSSGQFRTPIEFAVVWQCWSDEFTAAEVIALLAQLPLCRVVCVTGPWCESDQRTRRAWPPALVAPWWHAGQRLQRELAAVQTRAAHSPPWTASREELWLWEQSVPDERFLAGIAISLRMADHNFSAMLCEMLLAAGATAVQYPSHDVDVVLVDADPWSADLARMLSGTVQEVFPIRVIA